MSLDPRDLSIRGLHMVLGAVLARLTIASIEIVAAILFLVTATMRIGAFLLLAVLAVAVAIHVAHGQSPAALVVYTAAVLVVLAHRSAP